MFISFTNYDSSAQVEQLVVIGGLMPEEPQRFWGKVCACLWVYILYCCFCEQIIQEETFDDEKLCIDGLYSTNLGLLELGMSSTWDRGLRNWFNISCSIIR